MSNEEEKGALESILSRLSSMEDKIDTMYERIETISDMTNDFPGIDEMLSPDKAGQVKDLLGGLGTALGMGPGIDLGMGSGTDLGAGQDLGSVIGGFKDLQSRLQGLSQKLAENKSPPEVMPED